MDTEAPRPPAVRINLRPLGTPLPLGFFAFCFGIFLMSALELGWIPPSESRLLGGMVLVFCAPLELGPSVLAFLARDTAGGTVLGLFGASWLVTGLSFLAGAPAVPYRAVGFFDFLVAMALLVLGVLAVRTKPFFTALLVLSSARMVATALGPFGIEHQRVTGILGLVLAATALYGAIALLVEDAQQQTALPLFRRKAAKRAIEGDLFDQLGRLPNEPGVRQQL